jgi:hypothetical protein
VRRLERVFDIEVAAEDVSRVFTIGDFHDLLLSKIPPNEADRKCASAMAFYRIKGALQRLPSIGRFILTPGSRIGRTQVKLPDNGLEPDVGFSWTV